MNREGSWYGQVKDVTPTSVRWRERESNTGTGVKQADFDLDAFKRDLMDKFIEDSTAIA